MNFFAIILGCLIYFTAEVYSAPAISEVSSMRIENNCNETACSTQDVEREIYNGNHFYFREVQTKRIRSGKMTSSKIRKVETFGLIHRIAGRKVAFRMCSVQSTLPLT